MTNISGEDVPRKRVLCKYRTLAAQDAEPATTTLSTYISTSAPTELRPDYPTTTKLVLAEDKSEAA